MFMTQVIDASAAAAGEGRIILLLLLIIASITIIICVVGNHLKICIYLQLQHDKEWMFYL